MTEATSAAFRPTVDGGFDRTIARILLSTNYSFENGTQEDDEALG